MNRAPARRIALTLRTAAMRANAFLMDRTSKMPTLMPHVRRLAALTVTLWAALASAQAPSADCPPKAQPLTTAQVQAGMRSARDHGFLWRVSKNGRSSWLYGTLHVGKPDWGFPGPKLRAALGASDTIALEIDALDPSMQQRMGKALAAQSRPALPAEMQARLDHAAQAECLPAASLASMAPEMQIATLTTLLGRRDGLDPGFGTDMFLAGYGHGRQLAVVSLETPELQLALLQSDTPAETVEAVGEALDDIESGKSRATLLRVSKVWADSDWSALSGYASWCDCLNTPRDRAEMVRLLDDRNPAMADGIAALHASGQRVFAAVGSLHMIGPEGLPAQMARRGYRVERIEFERPTETTP